MAEPDVLTRLTQLKTQVAETDRLRARAEARHEEATRQLAEVDKQIAALGVKPAEAEATLAKLDAALATELTAIEQALAVEAQAYQDIVKAR